MKKILFSMLVFALTMLATNTSYAFTSAVDDDVGYINETLQFQYNINIHLETETILLLTENYEVPVLQLKYPILKQNIIITQFKCSRFYALISSNNPSNIHEGLSCLPPGEINILIIDKNGLTYIVNIK